MPNSRAPSRAPSLTAPIGSKLVFSRLVGHDEVNAGLAFTVSLAGVDLEIAADAILDRPMAIETGSGDPKRWFHGLVTAFRLVKVVWCPGEDSNFHDR